MRVLLLHNRYQQRGGEDAVVEAELSLLRAHGHDVATLFLDNDDIGGGASRVSSALLAAANPAAAARVAARVSEFRPDVVHIHNFFPRFSPSVHRAVARQRVAVVQTLHNYRLLCAAAIFFRDGVVCEDCLGQIGTPAIRHACYRHSRLGSAAVVAMQATARARGIWHSDVDRFVALTQFARSKFIAGGLPADRIAIKPNFLDAPKPPSRPRHGALYVGRLSPEKGVEILLDAWRTLPTVPLTIVGDGPMEEALRRAAPPHVHFAGARTPEQIAAMMADASLLVVPSLSYEGFPMVLVEAAAAGLPVLASRLGSLAEIVEPNGTGALFEPGSAAALAEAATALLAAPDVLARLGEGSRARYDARYSPAVNVALIRGIYEDAIARARAVRGAPAWA